LQVRNVSSVFVINISLKTDSLIYNLLRHKKTGAEAPVFKFRMLLRRCCLS